MGWGPNEKFSRRKVLKLAGASAFTLYLQGCSTFGNASRSASKLRILDLDRDCNPIDRTLGEIAPRRFSGDDPTRAHHALWDKAGYLAANAHKIPREKEKVGVVVIGGGMSGLLSAYCLRSERPIILEQAARFGGNSRAESWRGLDYSIGAAYVVDPEVGSPMYDLVMGDLKLGKYSRLKTEEDPVALGKTLYDHFWEGSTDPHRKNQFDKVRGYLTAAITGTDEVFYPQIPIVDETLRGRVEALDRISLKAHLESVAGSLHPHLLSAVEHYCWSAFAASSDEISAAAGVNFLASEFGKIRVPVGGNAAIAERLFTKLRDKLPEANIRPLSTVINLQLVNDKVEVLYEDENRDFHYLEARAVVMACPKFIATKLLSDLEPERKLAIEKTHYRAYLVANALVDAPSGKAFYDLFRLGQGQGQEDSDDVELAARALGITDVVLAEYAAVGANRGIFTLYRPLPYDKGRAHVYADGSYEKFRIEIEKQFYEGILPLFHLKPRQVVDFRLARFGHAIPMARIGAIASKEVDQLRKPFGERIFFVNQDNWLLPCFEACASEAIHWAKEIKKIL